MKRIPLTSLLAWVCVTSPALAGPADIDDLFRGGGGGVVLDHPPQNTGGPASDSEFEISGTPLWQQLADYVYLPGDEGRQTYDIGHIRWWGFYGDDFDDFVEPPPATETMRIRFYGDDAGLPDDDNIVFESQFLDPSRTETGRIILTGALPPEFAYDVDLATPVSLQANVPYWLEIMQVGDVDSHYRWEYSTADDHDFVGKWTFAPNWEMSTLDTNLAVQLFTVPEPTSLTLLVLGLVLLRRPRHRKGGCRG